MEKLKLILVITFLMMLPFSLTANGAETTDTIVRVEITGNERIDTGVIANAIKTKENTPYNLEKIREDMKSIYKTGFFSDVQIDINDTDKGKVVTFVVV